jgi:uncharacterized protein YqjF (DUF2071 family)
MGATFRQGRVTKEAGHRPWPLPDRPWLMGQSWERLLFAHWRVDPEALSRVMPANVEPDVFDGDAWIGVTPFMIKGLRMHATPALPRLSTFPELNVRTYTTVDGKPGIWFLSLDTRNPMAVPAARKLYRLPYHRAEQSVADIGEGLRFLSSRRGDETAAFEIDYRPTGPVFNAAPGSLDWFLTERYCLYTVDERLRVYRGDIHHPPWPLQPAEAEIRENTMAQPYGFDLSGDPLLHFAPLQDVVIWRLVRV